MNEKILIIDDEENIAELIKFNLELNGYQTDCAHDGKTGISRIKTWKPDLVLLDIMLPEVDGITILQILRSEDEFKETPVIMMTAKSQDSDKFIGFESGADDYVTKPFIVKELVYRVKTVLKRSASRASSQQTEDEVITINDLILDFHNYQILKNQKKLELTLKRIRAYKISCREFQQYLPEMTYSTRCGDMISLASRTLDVHIRNLRKKIGDDNQGIIETVRGVGYKFNLN